MIAHNPLHGSGQAGFLHPALALGEDADAAQGIGMTDGRRRQPASDEAPQAIPQNATFLAAPRQRAMPEPPYLEPKEIQRRLVHGHPVVANVSTHHCLQPLAYVGDGFMHPSLKFGFHLVQFRLQPFADRLPQHREPSVAPLLHTDMCEAKKVERLRFPFSTPLPLVDRMRDFPMRPKATAAMGELGISRFPREAPAYVHGVSDRAGLCNTSQCRRSRWGLPLLLTASASRRNELTRLNTRPARSPVNASTPPLRAAPHDSGPMWVATSHSYDSCIHYTSPV
jgi:hypothetical protein